MDGSKVIIGDTYTLESPLLSQPFEGKVLNKLEHSAIVEITDCAKEDQNTAKDLQFKTVISFSNVKKSKHKD